MNLADDMEEFVTVHRGHGPLTRTAGEPTMNSYRLQIACQCGVAFELTCASEEGALHNFTLAGPSSLHRASLGSLL